MTYTLTIVRNEPNGKYDASEARRMTNWGSYSEQPILSTSVLSMEVTPEQFDRIRTAALTEAK